jgi:RND family efflux transporter MFP subunit
MKNKYQLLGVVLTFILYSCTSKKEEIKISTYNVIQPLLLDTIVRSEYVADIQALQNVEIRNRIQGFVEQICVDEGKFVQKGQLLFSISSKSLQQHLLKAKSLLKSAIAEEKMGEIELKNVEKLVEKNIVSTTELQIAKAKLDVLKAKVEEAKVEEEQAEHNLTYSKIKAPFDGVINRIPFKVGSLLEEGTLLTTISNIDEIYAYFHISEIDYYNYKKSILKDNTDEISLILANGQEHKYKGKIETIEGEIDNGTGNIAFRAKFPNNEKLIKHGSSGKILLATKIKNALIIPQKVSFENLDKQYVFIVDKNNTIKTKSFKIKNRLQNLYVVDGSLNKNDLVVFEGIQNLKVNDQIKPNLISNRKEISKLKED